MIVYSNMRFLIVDDFSEFRSSVRGMLNQMAAQHIDVASSGEEAIAQCSKTRYDIILHDYNLGSGKNGQQVLEELHHANLISPHCIFVMVTAESSQAMVMAALEFEPDAYLTKPFNRATLQQRLDKLVARKQALAPVLNALAQENHQAVIGACDRLLQSQPRYAPQCLRHKANALIALGRNSELVQLLEVVLAERPLPWALLKLADHWLQQDELDKAETLYEQGIKQFPMLPALFDGLARVHQARGESRKAQACLEQAVKVSPNNLQRQAELARAARENQDPERAIRAYRQAVNLGRNSAFRNPEHHLQLADTLLQQNADAAPNPKAVLEIRQTLGDLAKGWKTDVGLNARADLLQANVLTRTGKAEEARTLVDSACRRLNEMETFFSADTAIDMANQLRALGRAEQADNLLTTCIEMYGDDPQVMSQVAAQTSDPAILTRGDKALACNREGIRLYQQKAYPEALESFRAALAAQPRNISYALNTAQSLLRLLLQEPSDALKRECLNCLAQARNMPDSDPRHARYRKLRERVESL